MNRNVNVVNAEEYSWYAWGEAILVASRHVQRGLSQAARDSAARHEKSDNTKLVLEDRAWDIATALNWNLKSISGRRESSRCIFLTDVHTYRMMRSRARRTSVLYWFRSWELSWYQISDKREVCRRAELKIIRTRSWGNQRFYRFPSSACDIF